MAQRVAGKAKKHPQKVAIPTAGGGTEGTGGPEPASPSGGLEAECARLQAELAQAKARIKALEEQRELLINRIDWVIDSLHSLPEE